METTIKTLFLSAAILLFTQLNAQPGNQHSKVQAFKIAYLTNRLDLTPRQAQMFWPLYNEREKKLSALKREHKAKMQKLKGELKNLSENDINSLLEDEFDFRQKELNIKKAYNQHFKGVLPIRKVAVLYRAEESFKRELLRKIQQGNH